MSSVEARPGIWGTLENELRLTPSPDGDAAGLWDSLAFIVDPAEFRPQLSNDIEIKEFRLRWGNDYAMIANPRDLIHYELKPEEIKLMRLMDGTRTVKEIVVDRLKETGDLDLATVVDLVRLLHEGNFLDHRFQDADEMVRRAMNPESSARTKARTFARSLSIEWEGADRLVQWLYQHGLKWFFKRAVAASCAAIALAGFFAFLASVHSGRFDLSGKSLALGFLVLLGLDYLLTFAHELAHALVLTRHGRRVKSAGFMIYFGSPAFFIESSDCLMLERRQRMQQASAGAFAEFILAGVASLLVFLLPLSPLTETLYKFAVLNYLVISLNLTPLLELDGYFILADLIQVPDLRPRSLSFIRHDLWHKLRSRDRFSKQEVGLAVYGILGVLFTIFVLYTSYFFWKQVFGGLVARLWNGGPVTRFILVALALFITGPLIRGLINLLWTILRRVRAVWRRVRFRLETSWRVEAATLIDGLALFDDLSENILSDLAGRVRLKTVARGQPVVRQGDRATAFYVVRKGSLAVVEEDLGAGNERVLRVLGRGEGFGEVALSQGSPRTATVRALDEAELFEIDKGTFDQLLADRVRVPDFAPTVQAVAELREVECFSHLEPDELGQLHRHGEWMNLPPGGVVFEQGEPGEHFYAIRSGQVEVLEDSRVVARLTAGSYFGEVALLLDIPRTGTVRAITPVRAFRLGRLGFEGLVADSFKRGTLSAHVSPDRLQRH